jgi:hypothetical protein
MLKAPYGTRGTLRVKKEANDYLTEQEQILRDLDRVTRWAVACMVVMLIVGGVMWGTM